MPSAIFYPVSHVIDAGNAAVGTVANLTAIDGTTFSNPTNIPSGQGVRFLFDFSSICAGATISAANLEITHSYNHVLGTNSLGAVFGVWPPPAAQVATLANYSSGFAMQSNVYAIPASHLPAIDPTKTYATGQLYIRYDWDMVTIDRLALNVTWTCPADLSTSEKSFSVASADAGDVVGFTLTVPNTGASTVAAVAIADPLPANVSAMTWTATGTAGATGLPVGPQTGAINITGAGIPTGGKITITGSMTIAANAPTGFVTNTATISATGVTSFTKAANVLVNAAITSVPFTNNAVRASSTCTYTNATQCNKQVLVIVDYGKAHVAMTGGNDWTISNPTTFSVAPTNAPSAADTNHRVVASNGKIKMDVDLGSWTGYVNLATGQTLNVSVQTNVTGQKVADSFNSLVVSPVTITMLAI